MGSYITTVNDNVDELLQMINQKDFRKFQN